MALEAAGNAQRRAGAYEAVIDQNGVTRKLTAAISSDEMAPVASNGTLLKKTMPKRGPVDSGVSGSQQRATLSRVVITESAEQSRRLPASEGALCLIGEGRRVRCQENMDGADKSDSTNNVKPNTPTRPLTFSFAESPQPQRDGILLCAVCCTRLLDRPRGW